MTIFFFSLFFVAMVQSCHVMFVTDRRFEGDFGATFDALDEADSICHFESVNNRPTDLVKNHGGLFKAFLSTNSVSKYSSSKKKCFVTSIDF